MSLFEHMAVLTSIVIGMALAVTGRRPFLGCTIERLEYALASQLQPLVGRRLRAAVQSPCSCRKREPRPPSEQDGDDGNGRKYSVNALTGAAVADDRQEKPDRGW